MNEFGHIPLVGHRFRVDSWGVGPFILVVDKKVHRFEDSVRFGPNRIRMDGREHAYPWWPERHRFWAAHRAWVAGGRRLEADGVTCVWDEPKPTIVRRLSRRDVLVITEGDEDGGMINEQGERV